MAAQVTNFEPDPYFHYEDYKECGGVVPISTIYTTTISYKEGEPFLGSEFCIWTLLPHGSVERIKVEVTPDILDSELYGLIAYFWDGKDLTASRLRGNTANSTFDPPPSFLALSVNSAGTTTTAGIRIRITPTGKYSEALIGNAYHIEDGEGEFSYPEKGSLENMYANNERISIVLPTRGFANPQTLKETKLKAVDVETDHDYISVYSIYWYWDSAYLGLVGRHSGQKNARFVTQYSHPIIILFACDDKISGKGFTVQWGRFSSKQKL
jgi:hypothetical protein